MKLRQFDINLIRSFAPCYDPVKYIPENWKGSILDILALKEVSFHDKLWLIARTEFVSEKLMRLFAVWCARQVQHLMTDERSTLALDVAERFANGLATRSELYTAQAATWDAAWAAARYTAQAAAWDAAWDAARYAAQAAARYTAEDAAWAAARYAARYAAEDAAEAKQEAKLREMIISGIETGDVVLEAE